MGYYARWSSGKNQPLTSEQLDAYRMQEIAFGHAPYLGQQLWHDVPQILLETRLIAPVAASYGAEKAVAIEYGKNGQWIAPSQAVLENKTDQLHVRYSNGLEIVANSSAETINWRGYNIPTYGWVAIGPGLQAYTALCGTHMCDYAETDGAIFANARNAVQINSVLAPATITSADFVQTGERRARLLVRWEIYNANILRQQKGFVHFTPQADSKNTIAFQAASSLSAQLATSNSDHGTIDDPVEIEVPEGIADGDYVLRIGAYDPVTGARQLLVGQEDGTRRYQLGTLHVRQNGKVLGWLPADLHAATDRRLNSDNLPLDFGGLRTNGMVWLTRSSNGWTLHAYPENTQVSVSLKASKFLMPAAVQTNSATAPVLHPALENGYWNLPAGVASTFTWKAPSAASPGSTNQH
jgi:hypothetical protein